MSDCCSNKKNCCGGQKEAVDIDAELKKRPRSPTLLNLSWLRDRLSKVKDLKEKIASGKYETDPEKAAKAILNKEE
jgi:anti-sigma28 factor (negative regulator of flagellin synthesis)